MKSLIAQASGLRLIGCARSNPVNVAVQAATARHIPVLYTPGRNAASTAEYTLGLMLAECRHIARSYHALKSGQFLGSPAETFSGADMHADVVWDLDGNSPYKVFPGRELSGSVLGLIGLGNVGSRVARLAQAFGMKVIAYSQNKDAERAQALGVELVPLERVLRTADFISIHCRVTPETVGLISEKEFAMMKPGAYLINTARAVVIDQAALIDALRQQRIAGAALDVYWYEPLPANHPLLQLDNVTVTPHLAGAANEVIHRHSQMIVDDVLTWLDGGIPEHVANPEVFSQA